MHDSWFTGDHFVGKLLAMGHPTRPTQPFIHPVWGLRRWRSLNGRPGLHMTVWLQVKVRRGGLGLRSICRWYASCLWHESAAAAAVCALWRYMSVTAPLSYWWTTVVSR